MSIDVYLNREHKTMACELCGKEINECDTLIIDTPYKGQSEIKCCFNCSKIIIMFIKMLQ